MYLIKVEILHATPSNTTLIKMTEVYNIKELQCCPTLQPKLVLSNWCSSQRIKGPLVSPEEAAVPWKVDTVKKNKLAKHRRHAS